MNNIKYPAFLMKDANEQAYIFEKMCSCGYSFSGVKKDSPFYQDMIDIIKNGGALKYKILSIDTKNYLCFYEETDINHMNKCILTNSLNHFIDLYKRFIKK